MSRESNTPTDQSNEALAEWSRRAVLRVAGAELAVAGLGSTIGATVAQEGDDDALAVQPPEELPPNVASVLSASELEPRTVLEQGTVAWADLTFGGQ